MQQFLLRTVKTITASLVCTLFFLTVGNSVKAQVAVTVTNPANTTPNLAASYTSLANAVSALNGITIISGPVTLTAAAGTETAPAGGYTINFSAATTSTNNVVITGTATTTLTAPTPQASGSLTDAIFKVIGSDFVTIQNFTMLENASNTTTAAATNNMTEFGVALFYNGTTNGAQNITIQNNIITLNRTYQNTWGIYSNSTHSAAAITTTASATTTAGGNSGMKVYGNTISNVNQGICVVGPTAAADMNAGLDIGGTGGAQANSFTNWGTTGTFSGYVNVSGTLNCILVRNTLNYNVAFNTITSSVGGNTASTQRGIYVPSFSIVPTGTQTNTITNNNISIKSGATASTINGITVESSTASATSSIAINSNDFNNTTHTVASSGSMTFITCTVVTGTTNINSNTFTNLSVNTTGAVTLISNSVTYPTSGNINNVNSNVIVTGFTRTSAGSFTGITTSGSSVSGVVKSWSSNNISNVTLTGASTFIGINETDGGTVNHNVTNNTISNITGGSNSVTGIVSTFGGGGGGTGNLVTGNTISNLSGSGIVTGISIGSSGTSSTVTGNTIRTLSSTGAAVVTGITSSAPTSCNIFKNKIYDLSNNNATGTVMGVTISSGILHTVYNNLIGDLRAPSGSSATDAIRGINITSTTPSSTINLYYNTIYINATSTGANFSTAGVFHTYSTTSTTAALNLRNNIITNLSTPNGTGFTVAFRRSAATDLNNYATTSNNNLFYSGTPGTFRLIYYDGTNSDQTLAAFKSRVTPRETGSVTENPNFLSTTGSSANFLHINTTIATQIESGGAPISAFTDDYDGDTRNASTPDIGADEFAGVAADITPPVISYTALGNACSGGSRTLTATITDASGVGSGTGLPVLYWKINAGSYTAATATSLGSNQYQFTLGTGSVTGDVVSYYIVAQDNASPPNIGAFPSAGASGFSNDPPAASVPPTTPSSYTVVVPLTGTYTVGVGGNYTTLTAAAAAYNTGCLGGPIVFSLTDASYSASETFPITINANTGASSTNTLTIRPASGVTATISGSNVAAILKLNGADYVTIDGSNSGGTDKSLTISNSNTTTTSAVIWLASVVSPADGATNNTIKNCIITGNASTTTFGGIISSGSTAGAVAEAANSTNTYQNNTISFAQYGVATVGPTTFQSGTTISQNIIGTATNAMGFRGMFISNENNTSVTGNTIQNIVSSASAASGIFLAGTTSGVNITGNMIKNINSSASSSGTASVSAIFVGATNSNTVISGDSIRSVNSTTSGGYGVRAIIVLGSGTTIKNNMISDVTNFQDALVTSYGTIGIDIDGAASNVTVNYNSVNLFGSHTGYSSNTTGGVAACIFVNSTGTGLDIRNNILRNSYDNSTSTGDKSYSIYSTGSANTQFSPAMNYNDYFVSGTPGVLGFISSADRATLAAMQTGFGGNINSYNVDPIFVSNTNLHLYLASSLDGGATPISGITTDIDGDTRNATTPDVGADEYTAAVPVVINSVSASPGGQCTAQSHTITANTTSGGTNITSVILSYQLNGGTTTTVTMTGGTASGTSDWTGVIPAASPTNAVVTWSVTATDGVASTTANGTAYQDDPLNGVIALASASVNPVCSGNPTSLSVVLSSGNIPAAPAATSYCTSTHSSGCSGDNMSKVVLNTLNNTTGTNCGGTTHYTYFNGGGTQTTTLSPSGSPYSLSVTFGTDGNQYFGAWIDYNHDGTYSTSEFLGASGNAGASGTIAVSFSVPSTAYNGLTHIRIVGGNDAAVLSAQACGASSSSFGETQDYDVTITGAASTVTYGGTISSYSWSDGTMVVGTTNPLTVSPTTNTTYTVTATSNGCTVTSSGLAVTVNPVPSAPTGSGSNQCGVGTATWTATSTTGASTPTFRWYAAASGGSPLQSSTSTTYSASISVTTTVYVTEYNGTCESTRTPVTATVNQPDALTAKANGSTSPTAVCPNTNVSLTAEQTGTTNTYTYTWTASPQAGSGIPVGGTAGQNITVTPTVGGVSYIYTVTGVDGSCSYANSVTLAVTAPPTIDSVRANPAVVCSGGTVTLKAYSASISSGSQTLPSGYCITGLGGGPSPNITNVTFGSINNSVMTSNLYDAYGTGAGFTTNATAGQTMALSVTANASAIISVWIDYNRNGTFEVSEWNQVTTSSTANVATTINVAISSSAAAGATYMRIRSRSAGNANGSGNACTSFGSGQAADYVVNLIGVVTQNPNLTYTWTPGSLSGATVSVNPTSTTLYTVTVTDPVTTCSNTGTVNAIVSTLSATASASNNPVCQGSSTTVSATATGGASFTYSWSDGTNVVSTAQSFTASPTVNTTYTVTVTNECSETAQAHVDITVNNPQPTSTTPAARCGTGTVTLQATAASGNTIEWYAASTGGSLLGSGTSFTTPSISSTTTYYAQVTQGGSTQTGLGLPATGVPSTTGATAPRGIVFTATSYFTLVSAQYYSPTIATNTVTVTLVDNSTSATVQTATLTIPQTAAGWFTMNLNWQIVPGTYRLLASFSSSVNRDGTTQTYPMSLGTVGSITSGYDAGVVAYYSYFHNITIFSGCAGTRVPVTATVTAPPSITVTPSTATICTGGTGVSVTASSSTNPDYTYVWAPGSLTGGTQTLNPSSTTTYTVTATDNTSGTYAGCSTTGTALITVNTGITMGNTTATPSSICSGGSATLATSASQGSTGSYCTPAYTSYDGTDYIANLSILNGAGTSTLYTRTSGATALPCYDNETLLTTTTLTGGTTYQVSLTTGTFSGTENLAVWIDYNHNGVFTDAGENVMVSTTVTTASAVNTVSFTVPAGAYNGTTRMRCVIHFSTAATECVSSGFGETEDYTINITGATDQLSYAWSPGGATTSSFTASGITATTLYTVTVSAANGCTATGSATVTVLPNYTITASAGANGSITPSGVTTLCEGGSQSYTITANSGYHIVDVLVDGVSQGAITTYTFTNVTTNHTISATFAQDCTVPTLSTNITNVTCFGGTNGAIDLILTGGSSPFTYSWSGPGGFTATSEDINTLVAGTYNVTVTATGGCTTSGSYSVTQPNAIVVTATPGSIGCNGGTTSVTVSATGGSGVYSSGTGTFSNVTAGMHTYPVTDNNGCTGTTTITISEPSAIVVTITYDPVDCNTGTTTVHVSATGGSGTYVDGTGDFTDVPVGGYTAIVTDDNTCTGTSTITITGNCSITLNMKMYLQGYYMGGGVMQNVLFNQGVEVNPSTNCDNVDVELHDVSDPTIIVATATGMLLTDGTMSVTLPSSANGGSYYIAIKHRNTVQTWSADPVTLGSVTSYDFTTDAGQAYGSNMIEIEPGIWAFYSGDVTQDEFMGSDDVSIIDNDNLAGLSFDFLATDINGDGFVGSDDVSIADNNNLAGVFSQHP